MLEEYVLKTISCLSEAEAQHLVTDVYQNDGWTVKNVHERDPRFEEGADIIATRGTETCLIAVKKSPNKGDLEQVTRLATRGSEGKLLYIYLEEPTEPFRKEIARLDGPILFLGPQAFHKFLVQHESVSHLVNLFSNLLITNEVAFSVAQVWACRNVSTSVDSRQIGDIEAWWTIKDAVLKVRASLGVLATRWEDRLMGRRNVDPSEFEPTLRDVVEDLDYVQRYAGGQLAETFVRMRETRPDVLATLWKATRMRTYWIDFALPAEDLSSEQEVVDFARKDWIVPGTSHVQRSGRNLGTMRFFYSGLAGIVRQMAEILTDFDHGVELAWHHGPDDN